MTDGDMLTMGIPRHEWGCHEDHGVNPVHTVVWPDGRRDVLPTCCYEQGILIDPLLEPFTRIESFFSTITDDQWDADMTLHQVSDDVYLLVVGRTDERDGNIEPFPMFETVSITAIRGDRDDVMRFWNTRVAQWMKEQEFDVDGEEGIDLRARQQRPVWCYSGDRGNVIVSHTDPKEAREFLAQVEECKTVADVRRLNEETGGALEAATEMFDEDGWADQDPWDISHMPGYEEGYWPSEGDLGMAELFTDEEFTILVEHCQAKIIDNMGGNGESLYIPDSHLDEVRALLAQWGFNLQDRISDDPVDIVSTVEVRGHVPGCSESHGGQPVARIAWQDGREDSVPTWCRAQGISIDAALTAYPPIRSALVEGAFEYDTWLSLVTLHQIDGEVFLLVLGETEARAGRRDPFPEGDSFEVIAIRGSHNAAVSLWERQLP